MARFALETAVVHSRFASVRTDEGIFLPKSWLDVYTKLIPTLSEIVLTPNIYGVFLASLILILGGFWSYETHAAEQMSVTPHQLQEARQQGLRVIQSCATDDPVSKVLSLVLQNMASAVDHGGVRVAGDPIQVDSQSTSGSSFVNTNTLSTLQQSEGIDLSSCSFFLAGGRSPDYEQEVEWEWESHSEAFHTLAEYISRNMTH